MKKDHIKGFLAGFLCAGLIAGLGITAMAAGRSLEVGDPVKLTINGAGFTPKDAAGKTVEVFVYNGTTYAPLRAICEAAGLQVTYDADSRTAMITTPDVAQAAHPVTGSYITADQAKAAALTHAGVDAVDTVFLKVRLDWDDGRPEYDVEFYCGAMEYDYDIDALTGEVLGWDHECEHYDIPAAGGNGVAGQISAERAREIALERAGGNAVVVKCKLDWEHGRTVYELELRDGAIEYECDVDAVTGEVISWEQDYDHHQASSSGSTSGAGALITAGQAGEIALERAGGSAVVVKCELDQDHGRTIYELELRDGAAEYECDIDASTGDILKWETDRH